MSTNMPFLFCIASHSTIIPSFIFYKVLMGTHKTFNTNNKRKSKILEFVDLATTDLDIGFGWFRFKLPI